MQAILLYKRARAMAVQMKVGVASQGHGRCLMKVVPTLLHVLQWLGCMTIAAMTANQPALSYFLGATASPPMISSFLPLLSY
jgi:hypothetical protein